MEILNKDNNRQPSGLHNMKRFSMLENFGFKKRKSSCEHASVRSEPSEEPNVMFSTPSSSVTVSDSERPTVHTCTTTTSADQIGGTTQSTARPKQGKAQERDHCKVFNNEVIAKSKQ